MSIRRDLPPVIIKDLPPEGYSNEGDLSHLYHLFSALFDTESVYAEEKQAAYEELQRLNKNGMSIDAIFSNETVACRFAQEQRTDIVDYLIKNHHVNIAFVLRGYAKAGRNDLIKKILKSNSVPGNINDEYLISILQGLVSGKDININLINEYFNLSKNKNDSALVIAVTAAQHGHQSLAENFSQYLSGPDLNTFKILTSKDLVITEKMISEISSSESAVIAQYAANTGNDAIIQLCLKLHDSTYLLRNVFDTCATNGKFDLVEKCIQQLIRKNPATKKEMLYSFARNGAAKGGHKVKMEEYSLKSKIKDDNVQTVLANDQDGKKAKLASALRNGQYSLSSWMLEQREYSSLLSPESAFDAGKSGNFALMQLVEKYAPDLVLSILEGAAIANHSHIVKLMQQSKKMRMRNAVLGAIRGQHAKLIVMLLEQDASLIDEARTIISKMTPTLSIELLASLENKILVTQILKHKETNFTPALITKTLKIIDIMSQGYNYSEAVKIHDLNHTQEHIKEGSTPEHEEKEGLAAIEDNQEPGTLPDFAESTLLLQSNHILHETEKLPNNPSRKNLITSAQKIHQHICSSQAIAEFKKLKLQDNTTNLINEIILEDLANILKSDKSSDYSIVIALMIFDEISERYPYSISKETALSAINLIYQHLSTKIPNDLRDDFIKKHDLITKLVKAGSADLEQKTSTSELILEGYDKKSDFYKLYHLIHEFFNTDENTKSLILNKIEKMLESGVSIDCIFNKKTITEKFAEEQHTDAVDLLISKFNADVKCTLRGFASVGRGDLVKQILDKHCPNKIVPNDYIWKILDGASFGGHSELVNHYYKLTTNEEYAQIIIVHRALYGRHQSLAADYAGNINLTELQAIYSENCVTAASAMRNTQNYNVTYSILMYPLPCRRIDIIDTYLAHHNNRLDFFKQIISLAALHGHFDLVEFYIEKAISRFKGISKEILYLQAGNYAAQGGHKEKMVEYSIKSGSDDCSDTLLHATSKAQYSLVKWMLKQEKFLHKLKEDNHFVSKLAKAAGESCSEAILSLFRAHNINLAEQDVLSGMINAGFIPQSISPDRVMDCVIQSVNEKQAKVLAFLLTENPELIQIASNAIILSKTFHSERGENLDYTKISRFLIDIRDRELVQRIIHLNEASFKISDQINSVIPILEIMSRGYDRTTATNQYFSSCEGHAIPDPFQQNEDDSVPGAANLHQEDDEEEKEMKSEESDDEEKAVFVREGNVKVYPLSVVQEPGNDDFEEKEGEADITASSDEPTNDIELPGRSTNRFQLFKREFSPELAILRQLDNLTEMTKQLPNNHYRNELMNYIEPMYQILIDLISTIHSVVNPRCTR